MNKDMQFAIDKGWEKMIRSEGGCLRRLRMMDIEGLKAVYGDSSFKNAVADQYGLKEYQVEKFIRIVLQDKQRIKQRREA